MASIKKPASCPNCNGTSIKKVLTDWTAPHYEGYVCLECVQSIDNAIFPQAFITGAFRPKRSKGICRRCNARESAEMPFKKGKNLCVVCSAIIHNEWKSKNQEHLHSYRRTPEFNKKRAISVSKAQRASPESWIKHKMIHITKKSNEKLVGHGHSPAILIIDIDSDYLINLYKSQNGKCALSGLQMTHQCNSLYSISIDRIDSSIGYVAGNVQLVCKAINHMKNNSPQEDIIKLIQEIADVKYGHQGY